MELRLIQEYQELHEARRDELRRNNDVCATAIEKEMEILLGEIVVVTSGLSWLVELT